VITMRHPLLFVLLACLLLLPLAAAALPPVLTDRAPVPPNSTVGSLEGTRGNDKLSTDLVRLVEPSARLPGQSRADLARSLHGRGAYRGSLDPADAGEVYVYVSLEEGAATSQVDRLATVVARDEARGLVSAWVPEKQLLPLSAQPRVRSVRTVNPGVVGTGSLTSEGDAPLRADLFRAATGWSGAGMKVGVISDGVNTWTAARDSGDLPADFHVLSDMYDGDEGTAMAEIVHDIAPGASIYFHDAGGAVDHLLFNQAITALANAGCRVIVDDVSWLDTPHFEDGIIAQTVAGVIASKGLVYVGNAGNFARKHYQGQFRDQGGSLAGWHDFRTGGTGQYTQVYANLPPGGHAGVFLQWDDRFGHSGNDYNLYLCTMDGTILASSMDVQNGNDDPLEVAGFTNEGAQALDVVVWVKKTAGEARELEAYITASNGAWVYTENIVAADSITGNHVVPDEIAVAAADVASPSTLEGFSSHGPATIRWPAPGVRQKPDVAGPDGGVISGAGGWGSWDGLAYRFYGTSASAPHVAALAALVWSGKPNATAAEVREALLETAQDRGPLGWDAGWGFGWPDATGFAERLGATPSVRAVPGGVGLPTDTDADGLFDDVNGNGRKDFADVVLFFNQMTWIAENEPVAAFDDNGNGRIDFADVVWLFNHL